MTNTIKIKGIKKAVGEYNRANKGGRYSPRYANIMLDCNTGEVWTDEFYSIGHGDWKKYHDAAIINIGNTITENGDAITMKTVKAYAETACKAYAEIND